MKQKEFNNLNLEAGRRYTVEYRSTKREDRNLYKFSAYYNCSKGDTSFFDTQEWDNSFFQIYTRQIISII